MRFKTNEQKRNELIEALEQGSGASAEKQVPLSALKNLREDAGLTQSALARRSGVIQEQVNRIEAHKRGMSQQTAAKLAPALGVSAAELVLGHTISSLKARAVAGRLSPSAMMEAIQSLDEALPDNEVGEELMQALMQVLSDAVAAYNDAEKPGNPGEPKKAATKSAGASAGQQGSRRTGTGIRKDKPYARRDD